MTRFNKLSIKQLVNLIDSDIERYVQFELMSCGIAPVPEPIKPLDLLFISKIVTEETEAYDKKKHNYVVYKESVARIRGTIMNDIRNARQVITEARAMSATYSRYLNLCDGNHDIARRFFHQTYSTVCSWDAVNEVLDDNEKIPLQ